MPRLPPSPAEFLALIEEVRPKLRRLLVSRRVPPQDAEDLLQEAFAALIKRWTALEAVASLEAWLIGTLRNRIALYHRARGARQRALERLLRELPKSEAAPQVRRDIARDVAALLADLPARERTIVLLRYVEGMGPEEVAAAVGCSPKSVRSLTHRALGRVRRRMAGGS